MIANLIMLLCRIQYRHYKQDIFYIKGTGKDYGRYLLYTEKPRTAERMDKF